jgi:hypothetical protein
LDVSFTNRSPVLASPNLSGDDLNLRAHIPRFDVIDVDYVIPFELDENMLAKATLASSCTTLSASILGSAQTLVFIFMGSSSFLCPEHPAGDLAVRPDSR